MLLTEKINTVVFQSPTKQYTCIFNFDLPFNHLLPARTPESN